MKLATPSAGHPASDQFELPAECCPYPPADESLGLQQRSARRAVRVSPDLQDLDGPPARGDGSIRIYESCYFGRVPIISGHHWLIGHDYFDMSFLSQISHEATEEQMADFFREVSASPLAELQERGSLARRYFDEVRRSYFRGPTLHFLQFLERQGLLSRALGTASTEWDDCPTYC